jgi:hypothetical protein
MNMSRRDRLERRALEIIMRMGDKGILQRDLWRKLKASSREGSRISLSLSKKKFITRQRELSDGRWTYRVFINIRPIEVDSILDVPCVSCEEISKCETGGEVSPETCKRLTEYLLTLSNGEDKVDRPPKVIKAI